MSEIQRYTDAKIDQVLTNLLIGYGSNQYIGNMLMPRVSVKSDSDKFYRWDDNGINITGLETRRDDRSPAAEISIGVGTDDYTMEQHALKAFLTDTIRNNADSVLNVQASYAQAVQDNLDLVKEKAIKDLVFTQGNYASGNYVTLSSNDRWSQIAHADSDPQADILAAKEAMLKKFSMGNGKLKLAMGWDGYKFFKQHSKIKESVKYVQKTGDIHITLAEMADYLGVDEILVGTARYNTAKEGQTASNDFLWKTHAALIYVNETPVPNQASFGYELNPTHTPRTVSTYRPSEIKGEFIEVNEKRSLKVTANFAGYLFTNAFDVA